jgi:hypothetical protein
MLENLNKLIKIFKGSSKGKKIGIVVLIISIAIGVGVLLFSTPEPIKHLGNSARVLIYSKESLEDMKKDEKVIQQELKKDVKMKGRAFNTNAMYELLENKKLTNKERVELQSFYNDLVSYKIDLESGSFEENSSKAFLALKKICILHGPKVGKFSYKYEKNLHNLVSKHLISLSYDTAIATDMTSSFVEEQYPNYTYKKVMQIYRGYIFFFISQGKWLDPK